MYVPARDFYTAAPKAMLLITIIPVLLYPTQYKPPEFLCLPPPLGFTANAVATMTPASTTARGQPQTWPAQEVLGLSAACEGKQKQVPRRSMASEYPRTEIPGRARVCTVLAGRQKRRMPRCVVWALWGGGLGGH